MSRLSFPVVSGVKVGRPFFSIDVGGYTIRCLIDSGADIPVWCKSLELFQLCFPKAVFFKDTAIRGFGKGAEECSIYLVDDLALCDQNDNRMNFKRFKVAVLDKPSIPCELILSITLFSKMECLFDYRSHPPQISIVGDKDEYGVGIYQDTDSVYVFYEEDVTPSSDASSAA